ncbi:unnamed protein product [Macrosiphum euphorbiae]|uniref:Uncharacterized protein n=1 Tax=Macrosiphum euphorbiae TaxID=13131 RepID=A0AAV0Y705_9HEMI|nr:unnamed protein product [Macrosiphum euphorbiae]
MKKILKDLRNVTKSIDNYDRNLNNYNVTTHDVSAMAAIKIGYDFIYSTLEKIFDKGAAPSKLIHQNGSQNHQTFYDQSINGSQIHQTYNITIVNGNNAIQTKSKLRCSIENSTHVTWQRFVDDSSPLPASEPSNTTVSQEEP